MHVSHGIATRLILLAALALPLLGGCGGDGGDSARTTITISGAFALYPLVVQWADAYQDAHPDIQVDISAGGAGKGMSDVLAGAVDIAMVSREVRPAETSQGAAAFAVAKDAVFMTVNAENPVLDALLAAGITPAKGAGIWITGDITTWGQLAGTDDSTPISVYTRADASGAGEVWALFLGGSAQEDLQQGIAVQGDPGLAETVRQDRSGAGYNNLNFAYDAETGRPIEGLRVVPIDLDGDGAISAEEDFYADKATLAAAIADGRYPSPPARPLYLVTRGMPDTAAAEFIRWVLTEGQSLVSASGYIGVSDAQLQAGLDLLPPRAQ